MRTGTLPRGVRRLARSWPRPIVSLAAGVVLLLPAQAWAAPDPLLPLGGAPILAGADRSGEPAPDARSEGRVVHGEARFVPLAVLPDTPPLPMPRSSQDGRLADTLIDPASGDPYFLGFAAGQHVPARTERIDPLLSRAFESRAAAPRPHGDTYGFVMFTGRITVARVAELEALGLRIFGYHPSNCLRVALPEETLTAVAGLEFVRWIGVARPWQKVHPALADRLANGDAEPLEVHISVFETDLNEDSERTPFGSAQLVSPLGVEPAPEGLAAEFGRWRSNGWQQAALERLGVEIDAFSPRSNSFRARLPRARLEAVTALDFVQLVEPWVAPTLAHGESMTLINADLIRSRWNGGSSSAVVGGIVDSGLDQAHSGLNHLWGWGWDLSVSTTGPWFDGYGHGSHVGGTFFGRADADRSLDGVTPGLGGSPSLRIYNIKITDDTGLTGGWFMSDILDRLNADVADPEGNVTPRPHVINHSWGRSGPGWNGTEVHPRELDADIHLHRQLHVFACGNTGPYGGVVSQESAAKNTFSVGSVQDFQEPGGGYPGTLSFFSSRGPTGDQRWKPSVVAPGHWVQSVEAGTANGYFASFGTSMAAPHVAGFAAQVMDRFEHLRYQPATLSALLMASAMTKDGVTLSAPSTASSGHHNMYGAGRVEGFKAHNLGDQTLYLWNFDMDRASSYVELDLFIAAGTTRASFVMLYHEIAASAGASTALINDLDMYLDHEPFSPGGNTGHFFSHQSSRDNVETRILDDPQPGRWRIKVYPEHLPAGFPNTVKVGVAAVLTHDDLRPLAELTTVADRSYVKPDEVVELTATVLNPSYVASAVHLTAELGDDGILVGAQTVLVDGFVADLLDNTSGGLQVTLGSIHAGAARSVRWRARWGTEGSKAWTTSMQSENAGEPIALDSIVVDGTPPDGPTSITSSHPIDSALCNPDVVMSWTAATDNLSGVDGYHAQFDQDPSTDLPMVKNLEASTTHSEVLAPSAAPYYFHIRPVDRSGNWGATQHYGPFHVGEGESATYCVGAPNSAGPGARLDSNGAVSIGADALVLVADQLPPGEILLFFAGTSATQSPLGDGFLCVGGSLVRLEVVGTQTGSASHAVDLVSGPLLGQVAPGLTWHFQSWYRDLAGGGTGSNLSDAVRVTFCE